VTSAPSSPFLSDTPEPDSAAVDVDDGLSVELVDRLTWFVRLRWGAALALALGSLLGPVIGLPRLWPDLAILALVLVAYNQYCRMRLRHAARPDARNLRVSALMQIALDLMALLVVVHCTGDLASPLLPFFGFHMAIGTILVSTEWMYMAAGLISLTAFSLQVAGVWSIPTLAPAVAAVPATDVVSALALLAFVGFLFGIVYLTGSVSDRLKQRNQELREASKALEERSVELQRLLGELADLERRKSHYMRISAHQLRSPLGTVRTSLDVLTSGLVDLASARGQRLMRGAAERVDGLLLIVNGLLDLAKVREGRLRAPWTRDVNLNQLIADILDALTPYSDERGVVVETDFAGRAVLEWGVPPDLVHAFENLIHNAIKYSFRDGTVTVRLVIQGESVVVFVEDHGIGVPGEFRDQLFLEFVRAPNARHHAPVGTGLGLALVREVASNHGGRAVLDDTDGPGSIFRLELPLRRTPPEVTQTLQVGDAAGYKADTGLHLAKRTPWREASEI
jgi:signal transduction histidine kinase